MSAPPRSEAPIQWSLLPESATIAKSGHLVVGGVDLVDLAGEVGTPFFAYDEEHLRARCREADRAWGGLDGHPGAAYAAKAFWCTAMARIVAQEGLGADVATGGEMAVALAGGIAPQHITFHGNNKSELELMAALSAGVGRIVVDSFDEISRLEHLLRYGVASGQRQKVLVRVTPGVEAHTHEFVQTGREDSKFGFSLASGAAAQAVDSLKALPGVELAGVHMHIGSQIFLLDAYSKAISAMAAMVGQLSPTELCIGGGLGVAYVNGESAPSITEWAQSVRDACMSSGIGDGVFLSAEPGRAIVATAGITCYTVGTVKDLPGIRTYVAVDGGMSDNPRPVLYGSGYEAFLPREVSASRPCAVRVVGKHCESGDIVVSAAQVPDDIVVGDVIATPVTGAYGYSMASNYNKVPRPPVVFCRAGEAKVVVRRETEEDLLRLDQG